MKLIKILIVFAAGGIFAAATLLIYPEIYLGLKWRIPAEAYNYSKAANAYLLRMDQNVAPGRLILIGDSQIESMDVSGFRPDAVNFGIGGDTWFGLSQRMPDYTSLSHADGVVLLAGINDLRHTSVAEIVQQAKGALNMLPDDVPVYLASIMPVDPVKVPISLSDIQLLNDGLETLCRENCSYIDVYNAFLTSAGTVNTSLLQDDGIHLNRRGYQILKNLIQATVDRTGV